MQELTLTLVASNVIRGLTALLAIFVISQIIWGVFLKMTHGGNEDRKDKAAAHMKHAVIGLIVVVASSSAIQFVLKALFRISGMESNGF